MSDEGDIIACAVAGFFFGAYLFFTGWRSLRKKRLIENTPTSKIRSLAMGLVEICGKVIPAQGKLIKSPFGRKECVYCRWKVQKWVSTKNGGYWDTFKKGDINNHFFIKDDTGYVLVDPKNCECELPIGSSYNDKLPAHIVEFLHKRAIKTEGWIFNRRLRVVEHVLTPGEEVYVLGTCADNPFVADGSAKRNSDDLMICKGKKDDMFFISCKTERELLKRLRGSCKIQLFGGPALMLGCLTVIFMYFGIL